MQEDVTTGYVPRTCEHCAIPFLLPRRFAKAGRGRFCSNNCRALAWEAAHAVSRVCLHCGTTFTRTPKRKDVCCSIPCANAHRKRPWQERFWEKVQKTESCWIWTGSKDSFGYGRLNVDGRGCDTHRLSYTLHKGPIPEGLNVLHSCPDGDRPDCVNPAHLRVGTKAENNADTKARGRSASGDRHFSRLHPERVSRGPRHSACCRPPRGDDHPWRKHPELIRHGEANDMSRLTDSQVLEIRRRRAAGERQVDLAREFRVSQATISNIVKGKVWRHLL